MRAEVQAKLRRKRSPVAALRWTGAGNFGLSTPLRNRKLTLSPPFRVNFREQDGRGTPLRGDVGSPCRSAVQPSWRVDLGAGVKGSGSRDESTIAQYMPEERGCRTEGARQ